MPARKHYMTVFSDRTGERVISPGEILTKELRRQRITQKELSKLLGRSEKFISQLITGKVRLTYDVAYDLERALKVPTSKWNAAEAAFQDVLTRTARLAILDNADTRLWAESFPYDRMVMQGLVPGTEDSTERAANILAFFGVANPQAYEDCRKSEKGLTQFKKLNESIDALR
ncbi:MAG: helix-turn-helix domain-containing protein [Actinobacteria bacterium]|nr:helix-turn-helix domain-containing protein [Actinomycetota bacterium]